jgi:DNA polymerase-3 subunit gamma/tau
MTPASEPASTPYRVLARKYRPQSFSDLVGQEAMVQTLKNAFETGRIHQAYLFTGVRGVGKTTTARIIARGLNYEPMDGGGGPTIDMAVPGRHCQAIMESRHLDVIEMDAASNTSINDVREIIDSSRYKPVSARYKVYIIDEVHMLSTAAFNGLLKTLEEPPEHVKFLFATTEIRKVPVTVLSRCQRFDLRRIPAETLLGLLSGICASEGVTAEEAALKLIVRAGDGSARDSLSLLDQAIAHGSGRVEAEAVRHMLGLADRSRVIDLFEQVMRGDVPGAFAEMGAQYAAGAEPAVIIADLVEFVHTVTRLKLVPSTPRDIASGEEERRRGEAAARDLSMRTLTRAWQILTKGLAEVQASAKPLAAAEMLIARLAYAADLPTPDEALKLLREGSAGRAVGAGSSNGGGGGGERASGTVQADARAVARIDTRSAPAGNPARAMLAAVPGSEAAAPREARPEPAAPVLQLADFEALVALAADKRDIALKVALERDVRLVRFEQGRLDMALTAGASPTLASQLSRKLHEWTGARWLVSIANEPGQPTLHEQREEAARESERGVRAHPLVRAALELFPGAAIVDVRSPPGQEPETPAVARSGGIAPIADEPDADGFPDEVPIDPDAFTEDDL